MPHDPQFCESIFVSTQRPLQAEVPAPQMNEHEPFEHNWFAGQALPHAPQLAGLLDVSMQTPLQSVVPPEQLELHTLFEQT
jgi:hypothetical protein